MTDSLKTGGQRKDSHTIDLSELQTNPFSAMSIMVMSMCFATSIAIVSVFLTIFFNPSINYVYKIIGVLVVIIVISFSLNVLLTVFNVLKSRLVKIRVRDFLWSQVIITILIVIMIFFIASINVPDAQKTGTIPVHTNVYVLNYEDDTVSVIDTLNNNVTAIIPVGNYPNGIVVTPDGKKVYVSNYWGSNISIIDTAKNNVTATVDTGKNFLSGVAVSSDNAKVYIAASDNGTDNNGTLIVLDTATNRVLRNITIGCGYHNGVCVSSDGARVYITNVGCKSISIVDTVSNNLVCDIALENEPWDFKLSHDGTTGYITNVDSTCSIRVVDMAGTSLTKIADIPTGNGCCGIALNPEGTELYVANLWSNNITIIDTVTNVPIATIDVGNSPDEVAVSPDGTMVYVANYATKSLSVIDISSKKVFPINLGKRPGKITVNPKAIT